MGFGNLPVCIAKTQYSFSDDSKNLQCLEPFQITIRDIELKSGAGFVVAMAGKIMTMPGLPKVPAAENIDIDENGNIVGIFWDTWDSLDLYHIFCHNLSDYVEWKNE